MPTRQAPRVLALASAESLEMVHEVLGELSSVVCCVDISRLCHNYGAGVANEVLRQLMGESALSASNTAPQPARCAARRRSR